MSIDPDLVARPRATNGSWISTFDQPESEQGEQRRADLTDAEIEHIHLEERCRLVIRDELAWSSASVGARLWQLLNSVFVLWLLTLVVVWLAATIYDRRSEVRAIEARRVARCEALDLEISYRISSALASLQRAARIDDLASYDAGTLPEDALSARRSETAEAVRRLFDAPAAPHPPLYPEHARLALPALVSERHRMENDPEIRDELAVILRSMTADSETPTFDLTPAEWTERIMRHYVPPRWASELDVKDPRAP